MNTRNHRRTCESLKIRRISGYFRHIDVGNLVSVSCILNLKLGVSCSIFVEENDKKKRQRSHNGTWIAWNYSASVMYFRGQAPLIRSSLMYE